ncbi:cytochrome c551 [Paucisalibacillus sp. EB02]|uniref:cytochrome c551 n=1 Tax=Paucisalibacillus sp. EB02 TaxID=1347087 RepID=UPI0004B177CE|nr:cytochrome c [Paucisalibacillus sp. EB02]
MKKWLLAILFGIALVLGACGGDDNGDDNGATSDSGQESGETTTASAEDIYETNCASCHGADLSGGAGSNLTAIGADYSVDELKDIIANGKDGGMPAFSGRLSDDEIQTLADWLGEKK